MRTNGDRQRRRDWLGIPGKGISLPIGTGGLAQASSHPERGLPPTDGKRTATPVEKKTRANGLLAGGSLFIYVYRGVPIRIIAKSCSGLPSPVSDLGMASCNILSQIDIVGADIGLYSLLDRHLPRLTALITGGR